MSFCVFLETVIGKTYSWHAKDVQKYAKAQLTDAVKYTNCISAEE